MSALLDGYLGSLTTSSTENSDMSGSFQSGFRGGDYDYGGSGVDRNDHYGGHSGYDPEGISFPFKSPAYTASIIFKISL